MRHAWAVPALVSLGIAFALTVSPARAADQQFGARAGIYTDDSDFFVGVEWLTSLSHSIYFDPNVEYAFAGHDFATVNADFHYDFLHDKPYFFWAGAGPALILRHDDPERDDSDWGVNVFAGFGWKRTGCTPYVQVKTLLSNDDSLAVALGVRF